jgi:hypothetical protein
MRTRGIARSQPVRGLSGLLVLWEFPRRDFAAQGPRPETARVRAGLHFIGTGALPELHDLSSPGGIGPFSS